MPIPARPLRNAFLALLLGTALGGCSLLGLDKDDASNDLNKDAQQYQERPVEQIYADAWAQINKNNWDDAAKQLGVTAEYLAPETFDMAKMGQMIDAAAASKPDGLVVSIPDEAALSGPIKDAVASGVPVIVIDSGGSQGAKDVGALLFLGQSEFEAGVMAGERIKALGITKAVCANHEVGNVSLDDRCAGFTKGLGVDVPVLNGARRLRSG